MARYDDTLGPAQGALASDDYVQLSDGRWQRRDSVRDEAKEKDSFKATKKDDGQARNATP
ncbi:hypothetical protein ES703_22265 [subsurface metagenome]